MAFQQKAVLMSERVNGIDHAYTISEYVSTIPFTDLLELFFLLNNYFIAFFLDTLGFILLCKFPNHYSPEVIVSCKIFDPSSLW